MLARDMRGSPRQSATYSDLEALADNLTGELLDGELFATPRPAPLHLAVSSALGHALGSSFAGGGGGGGDTGWWLLDEPELHLDDDVLVPDLAGWRRTRMPALPTTAFFELAPDWVCEILSPATARLDRVRKLPKYAAAGVAHAWIIDPVQRTFEVYRLEREHWILVETMSGVATVHVEPFAETPLSLLGIWGPEPERR